MDWTVSIDLKLLIASLLLGMLGVYSVVLVLSSQKGQLPGPMGQPNSLHTAFNINKSHTNFRVWRTKTIIL